MKFVTEDILDFREEFRNYRRSHDDKPLNPDDFTRSLRVFNWFHPDFEFRDVRFVCIKYNKLVEKESKDPYSQDLPELLSAYLESGSLENSWAFNYGYDVVFMVSVLAETYKNLVSERGQRINPEIYLEFRAKFEALDRARESVLYYISEFGFQHLQELAICRNFVLLDVIAIMYYLASSCDERNVNERIKVFEFIKEMISIRDVDLSLGPKWQVEIINNFLQEFEMEENNKS